MKKSKYDVVYPHYLGIMRSLSFLLNLQILLSGLLIGFVIGRLLC